MGFSFSNVLPAIAGGATAFFPSAGEVLGGFGLVQGVNQGINLVKSATGLIQQTENLVVHIDSMVDEISSTLQKIDQFVQDCDAVVTDIKDFLEHLPNQLGALFDENTAKRAFARIRADAANMVSNFTNTQTLMANANDVQTLAQKMVGDITTIDGAQSNPCQFIMQAVPALTTWVQGYTSCELLKDPAL